MADSKKKAPAKGASAKKSARKPKAVPPEPVEATAPEAPGDAPATPPIEPADEIEAIGFPKGKVSISFVRTGKEGPERVTVESPVQPHPDFVSARNALVPVLLSLCEIPQRAANKTELREVAFKRSKDESRGAILKGFRAYAESLGGMALNSPVRFEEDDQPQRRYQPDDWAKIVRLEEEALAYLAGKSAQGDLFASHAGDGAGTEADLSGGAPVDTEDAFDDGGKAMRAARKKAGLEDGAEA